MTSKFDEQYTFRRAMVDELERDLLGPGEDDEVLTDPPITRYVTGILYPAGSGQLEDVDGEDDADDLEGGEEGTGNPPVALASVRYPSSMGLTFAVDTPQAASILVEVRSAMYEPFEAVSNGTESTARSRRRARRDEGGPVHWRRIPLDLGSTPIDVTVRRDLSLALGHGLELFVRTRQADSHGVVSVTVVLVNRRNAQEGLRDADSFFQSEIHVSAGAVPAFVERQDTGQESKDPDLRSYRLLYRHAKTFAVGHGCAVDWETDSDRNRAVKLGTQYIPRYELNLADSNPSIDVSGLSMKALAEGLPANVVRSLAVLLDAYEAWIGEQAENSEALDVTLRPVALDHLGACRTSLGRMRRGLELLEGDPQLMEAFQLSNNAMFVQRTRAAWIAKGKVGPGPTFDDAHVWRPFQIGFFLVNIEGIATEDSNDRGTADLLWFPTGGGKTEAYLGLIAFTVLLRRLRNPSAGGVTVLMRYTLRLLTIQQFERAAILICALESIRRKRNDMGTETISIGLWVGKAAAPNTLAETKTALNKLGKGANLEKGNPVQIHSCPWCGTALDHSNYFVSTQGEGLVVHCGQDDCEFGRRLPVFLVDQDIYRVRPTLVIATADKFASLPWREEAAHLFNLTRPRVAPPALIIQDELHLISGPLGTLAGLYETAIDLVCEQSGARPKVIASTATIRRASQQSLALFDRPVQQFPPPGIDSRDSYFAVEASPEEKGTRMYVGLAAPGTSQTTLLVRTYAVLLQRASELPGSDEARDPYWTLLGYFNSLRVLGGATLQVQDDVRDRIELIASAASPSRSVEVDIEMTSRESSSKIPGHLKRMAKRFPDPASPNVILATNMISVGVDIDRLGLMAIMGQPQTTSEYIQSSSRVGRSHPGLVVTMFNAARSRDRSHYESFVGYHSALYRQVESTSVTPFSPRARDRGLHAVLIALARLLVERARGNGDAANVETFVDELENIRALIITRASRISDAEATETARELDSIIEIWRHRAADRPGLAYSDRKHKDRTLLVDASSEDPDDAFPTMWSLRDVDRSSNLYLVR